MNAQPLRNLHIRSKAKLDKIVNALTNSKRRFFVEEMYDFNGRFFILFYH